MTVAKDTVLIWGAGAIGGTIGAYLARAGIPVKLVDLVADHVDAMNAQGLSIKGPVDTFTIPVDATTPERLTGTFGKVLLCVKGQDTAAAAGATFPQPAVLQQIADAVSAAAGAQVEPFDTDRVVMVAEWLATWTQPCAAGSPTETWPACQPCSTSISRLCIRSSSCCASALPGSRRAASVNDSHAGLNS